MGIDSKPVFYDESSRRWMWVVRVVAATSLIAAFAIGCFVVSIIALPLLPHSGLPKVRAERETRAADPDANARQTAKRHFAQRRDRGRLAQEIQAERDRRQERIRASQQTHRQFLNPAAHAAQGPPIVAGFYVNWEETSRASLRRNVDELTHLFPEWLHLSADGKRALDGRTPEDRIDIEPFARRHALPIVPVINNYTPLRPGSEKGDFDTQAVHKLVSNPANRTALVGSLKTMLLKSGWQGINIDFELIDPADRDGLVAFMRELYTALHPAGLLVTQDVELDSDGLDYERLALWNDFLVPMFYDQHSPGDDTGPGSIASIDWTREQLDQLLQKVPASKVIVGLGAYSYDWSKGSDSSDVYTLSYQSAVIQAKESRDPANPRVARIEIDPATLNPVYRYFDDEGKERDVWMLDATTAFNQWSVARPHAPRGVALWSLGAEDPGIWKVIGRSAIASDSGKIIDSGELSTISYGKQSQVDFEGEGELLKVLAEPSDGQRTLRRDPKTGLVNSEEYQSYPSGYVVRRYGYKPKSVVLTFDDGPDPKYTPRILDILKQEGIKGTFFVVGTQAESNPGIVARMWDEGHEIGNHTFFHPDLRSTGDSRTQLEINTTQRIIEAITGHSTTLFRPPFAIDVEPRTGGELRPIILASRNGFVSVGEKNDPQDWNLFKDGPNGDKIVRTAADIAESVWSNREEGNVVLLHDGGGDRAATVAALPQIIERFKRAGYKFISVADLRGVSRIAMFPSIKGREEVLVGVDEWVFGFWYFLARILATLFTLSVVLGVSRQVWLATLAIAQKRRERFALASDGPAPTVSVIIAAYNEERVIEKTVRAVQASDYPAIDLIVVDDGSSDATYDVVSAISGVRCVRKENGGKASALNEGLRIATGDIIVALDADTVFAPDAISKLARHFVDPRVGAVSGNVQVGNPHNLLTRWQALEYITSQNFDRRAYDLLNCITVVPGAIGAWRRTAIDQAGGYGSDTLAEDTDLTWRIRRMGWRILNDATAHAYTEAPETVGGLARQRFRWAFGTLQCLAKHRSALLRHGAFGWVALPSLWLYQILFPAISPIMDVTVLVAIGAGNLAHVAMFYGVMVGAEFAGAVLAIHMDRGNWRLLPWLFLQRLFYRQLMYYVILKSLVAAVRGRSVGWSKLERHGSVQIGIKTAVVSVQPAAAHVGQETPSLPTPTA